MDASAWAAIKRPTFTGAAESRFYRQSRHLLVVEGWPGARRVRAAGACLLDTQA